MGIVDGVGYRRQGRTAYWDAGDRVPSLAVGTPGITNVRIGLHQVSDLRWPKQPLTGDGKTESVAVPLPRLPWSSAAVRVPLGASAVRDIARVTTLRRIFGYAVAPVIILLFVLADVLLLWGRFGDLHPPGGLFAVLGVIGVLLILTGLLPDVVARRTGTPYVFRNQLRFPAARADVVQQLQKLNPKAAIEIK
jgi:hypothetical protein